MLNKNVVVKRPEGTKIYRQRDCKYVYYVLQKNYKKNKKYVVEKRVCIGKMIDDENMNPNDSYYQYFSTESFEKLPALSDVLQIGNVSLISKISDDLKIREILELCHSKQEADIILDLVSYIITRGTSTMQHYSDFAWNHMTNSERKWDDSKISGFLKNEISYAQIEKFMVEWNKIQDEHADIYISYDSTNMNTKAEGVDMAEYGHAKDDKEVPQVNISYAVNHKDATPLFYEMYPGSIIDNTQCTYMVERAREYGYKNIGLILDRGYFSIGNIKYFDDQGYDFLMMIKKNSSLVQELLKDAHLPLVTTKIKYYLPEQDVYAMTKEGTIGNKKRYFHIYYDNTRASTEVNEYLKQLKEKEEHLKRKIDAKIMRKEDMTAYNKFFNLKYDNNGYLESYKRKEEEIQKEIDRLGFFIIVTSKEMKASEAIDIYRRRDSIEKIFSMLKTGMEYDTFRVHSQQSLESKTYVMFIASIVRNYIFQRLKELSKKDKKSFTVPAAISELEKITVVKNSNGFYIRRYGLTKKQHKILKQFKIDEKYLNSQIEGINLRI